MSDQPNTPQGSADRAPLKQYDIAAWYDWETSECGLVERERPEGDWVRYDDVCAEREAQEAELERLRKLESALLLALDDAEERDVEVAITLEHFKALDSLLPEAPGHVVPQPQEASDAS